MPKQDIPLTAEQLAMELWLTRRVVHMKLPELKLVKSGRGTAYAMDVFINGRRMRFNTRTDVLGVAIKRATTFIHHYRKIDITKVRIKWSLSPANAKAMQERAGQMG
jgi:hypothetical protein